MVVQSAAEAYALYKAHLDEGRLVRGKWQVERDGRQLACALGVLGIKSARQCPAQIMPRWLAQMVPWFFDNQAIDDAFGWGERFYAELSRLNGKVPVSVVHDWHANVVGPLAIEVATKGKRPTEPHQAVVDLHRRALSGDHPTADEWRPRLRDAYAYVNANAYAYVNVNANANAYANANADAYVNANADAYAYANAYAYVMKRLADGMVECLKRAGA